MPSRLQVHPCYLSNFCDFLNVNPFTYFRKEKPDTHPMSIVVWCLFGIVSIRSSAETSEFFNGGSSRLWLLTVLKGSGTFLVKFKNEVLMNLERRKLTNFYVRIHDKTELKCRSPWLYRVVAANGLSRIDCSSDSMMSLTLTSDNSIIWLDPWHDRPLFTWDVPLHVVYTFDSHYHLVHIEYLCMGSSRQSWILESLSDLPVSCKAYWHIDRR